MANKVSVSTGIIRWLVDRAKITVKTSNLENEFVPWYRAKYGPVSVASAERRWRELKGVDGPLVVRTIRHDPQGCWEVLYYGEEIFWHYINRQRSLTHG